MSQERKLIYAVDDEPSIREVYSYALQAAGFEVACFEARAICLPQSVNGSPTL